ncbi:hypothetical protein CERZMDRAFT_102886 [Cercospora zeae-maydis SCOH1-5]|uniref:Uncharacterized protein n=1 Tax=Cercospora zeae-maydis SCOH1-5 TaxID=717836 RepID=A0A6A6F165_9PEZI|nr:hypothetical protein CERZMDRAFT_102886 [Cercospora zeae-maydis SCOH1-5]
MLTSCFQGPSTLLGALIGRKIALLSFKGSHAIGRGGDLVNIARPQIEQGARPNTELDHGLIGSQPNGTMAFCRIQTGVAHGSIYAATGIPIYEHVDDDSAASIQLLDYCLSAWDD